MKPAVRPFLLASCLPIFLGLASFAVGSTATSWSGLYETGESTSGGLLAAGSTDSAWDVTAASINGGSSDNTSYEGSAYVASSLAGGWINNTTQSEWIVPPGAVDTQTGGTVNNGGNYLPGNGTAAPNEGVYVYTLTFTISGTGANGSTVSNFGLDLTAAADDIFSVYVNPTLNAEGIPTGTAAFVDTNSAWTGSVNFSVTSANATFKIGTNTLVFVVDNTNEATGSSASTTLNASGLQVYELAGVLEPETGAWLPSAAAIGLCCGLGFWARRRRAATVS